MDATWYKPLEAPHGALQAALVGRWLGAGGRWWALVEGGVEGGVEGTLTGPPLGALPLSF